MKSGIVFCALARDCRSRLKRNYKAVKAWRREFPSARWLFIENDSRDGTRELLEKWAAADSRISVIGEKTGERTIPPASVSSVIPGYSLHRIERMARFRNIYLDWITENVGWDGLRWVVVIDPDVRGLPISRVTHWLRKEPAEQAVTAFGQRWKNARSKEFHDAYAFRETGDFSVQTKEAIFRRRATLSEKIRSWNGLYPVRSNFNGLGIYPAQAMRDCRYEALPNGDPEVESECEHLPFHDGLAKKGIQVVLDPELSITYNGWVAVSTGQVKTAMRKWFGKKTDE
ncbi:MAG: hypothetical protein QM680_01765 [Luteolibacter sp.]